MTSASGPRWHRQTRIVRTAAFGRADVVISTTRCSLRGMARWPAGRGSQPKPAPWVERSRPPTPARRRSGRPARAVVHIDEFQTAQEPLRATTTPASVALDCPAARKQEARARKRPSAASLAGLMVAVKEGELPERWAEGRKEKSTAGIVDPLARSGSRQSASGAPRSVNACSAMHLHLQ